MVNYLLYTFYYIILCYIKFSGFISSVSSVQLLISNFNRQIDHKFRNFVMCIIYVRDYYLYNAYLSMDVTIIQE